MLLNKMDSGSTNKKDFFIKEKEQNFYCITTVEKEWDCHFMRNKKVKRKYNSTFKLLA